MMRVAGVFGFTAILSVLLAGIFALSCAGEKPANTSGGNTAELSADNASDLEPVPEITSESVVEGREIQRMEFLLGVQIASGENFIYEIDGTSVQANYLVPRNQNDLPGLFNAMFSGAGNTNSILLGNDRVYELIGDDPWAVEQVRNILDLAALQRVKFTAHSIYGEGEMLADEIISPSDTESIASRLGIELEALLNQRVQIDEQEVQVNFLLPGANTTAIGAMNALAAIKDSEEGLYILGDAVVEVVTDDLQIAERIWRLASTEPLSPSAIDRFEVAFSVIPVAQADYMHLNDCSVLAGEGASEKDLLAEDPTLIFGGVLPFFLNRGSTRAETVPDVRIEMVDDSIAIGWVESAEGQDSPPSVQVTMTVETGCPNANAPEDFLPYLEATDFWPVESATVNDSLEEAMEKAEGETPREIAQAISDWVHDNITYSEGWVGSRWGTEQVLRQGYGRCWDHSDVFITLARTAGIPARQVDGWVYGLGGHVWSQVWLEDERQWVDVDTTGNGVGVDSFYIPIWGTRDGKMLFIYRDWPRVERLQVDD